MDVASFYIGAGLHPYLQACLASWRDYGHQIDVYTYDPDVVLPPGVRRRDAAEVLSSAETFTYTTGLSTGSVSAFANLFRYCLLAQREVTWVDTDMLCLTDQWPDDEYRFGWQIPPDRRMVNNAIVSAPRDSVLLARLIEELRTGDRRAIGAGDLGPRLLTRIVTELGLEDRVAEPEVYYPISLRECRLFFDPAGRAEIESRVARSRTVHLWNEVWNRGHVPTFLRPPEGSFLEGVLARHGIVIPVEARLTDLSCLDHREEMAVVPQADYLELEAWAHELNAQLTARSRRRLFRRTAD